MKLAPILPLVIGFVIGFTAIPLFALGFFLVFAQHQYGLLVMYGMPFLGVLYIVTVIILHFFHVPKPLLKRFRLSILIMFLAIPLSWFVTQLFYAA